MSYHIVLGVIAHKHINEFWLFNGSPPPLALSLSLSMVIFKERRVCSTTDWWGRGRKRGGRGSSLLFSLSFAQCLLLRLLWVFYKIKTSYSTSKSFSAARHASSTHCATATTRFTNNLIWGFKSTVVSPIPYLWNCKEIF